MAAQPERKHKIPPLPKGELRPYQCAWQPIALLIRPTRQQVDTCVDQCAFKPSQVWCITQQPVTTIKIPVNGNCQFHYHNIVIPQTLFQRPCQWPCYLCIYLFIVSNLFNFIYLTFWCVTLLSFFSVLTWILKFAHVSVIFLYLSICLIHPLQKHSSTSFT